MYKISIEVNNPRGKPARHSTDFSFINCLPFTGEASLEVLNPPRIKRASRNIRMLLKVTVSDIYNVYINLNVINRG